MLTFLILLLITVCVLFIFLNQTYLFYSRFMRNFWFTTFCLLENSAITVFFLWKLNLSILVSFKFNFCNSVSRPARLGFANLTFLFTFFTFLFTFFTFLFTTFAFLFTFFYIFTFLFTFFTFLFTFFTFLFTTFTFLFTFFTFLFTFFYFSIYFFC